MIVGGLCLGLLLSQMPRLWQAAPGPVPAATPRAANPYAEAARSREILEAQEGAPPSAARWTGAPGGGVTFETANATSVTGPVHVIDGDTFDYGGLRIRIADIDTPEVQGQCAHETQLAARATRRLHILLAAGPFQLHPPDSGRDEDRHGRKLRIVTRGGRSLGDVLVAEGLARTWTGRREPWC